MIIFAVPPTFSAARGRTKRAKSVCPLEPLRDGQQLSDTSGRNWRVKELLGQSEVELVYAGERAGGCGRVQMCTPLCTGNCCSLGEGGCLISCHLTLLLTILSSRAGYLGNLHKLQAHSQACKCIIS